MNLDPASNAYPVAQAPVGLAHNRAELPASAGADLLEHVDLGSARSAVHRARHGRDCPSFSNLAQKARRSGHHNGHQNWFIEDTMVDTTAINH
jgi:hypothetical protein